MEIPRAAFVADKIAETAEFFSFGTNDLTQTTLGMSRDDSGSFLGRYKELDILPKNPFASIDYGCGLNYTANKWKYTLGEEWSINKKHKITCFFRYQTEDYDDEPDGLMIGMGYKIKF